MGEEETRDQLAAMRAGMDQLAAANDELAAVIAAYFQALLAHGLERGEALLLTNTYEQTLLNWSFAQGLAQPEDG